MYHLEGPVLVPLVTPSAMAFLSNLPLAELTITAIQRLALCILPLTLVSAVLTGCAWHCLARGRKPTAWFWSNGFRQLRAFSSQVHATTCNLNRPTYISR